MLTSPYAIPPVTPPQDHPRLTLRAEDLPRIRANIAEGSAATAYWQELLVTPLVKTGATPQFGNYHLRDYLVLEARALSQLLSPDPIGTRALIDDLLEALQNFTVHGGNMGARWGGHLIFTAAEIFSLVKDSAQSIVKFFPCLAFRTLCKHGQCHRRAVWRHHNVFIGRGHSAYIPKE